jgi:hypothetical protein
VSAGYGSRYSVAFGRRIVLTYLTSARANHRAARDLGGSLEGEATCLRKLVGFCILLHKLSIVTGQNIIREKRLDIYHHCRPVLIFGSVILIGTIYATIITA